MGRLMVILCILAFGFVVATIFGVRAGPPDAREVAEVATAEAQMKNFAICVTHYYLKNGHRLPQSLSDIKGYLDPPSIPLDPWGNVYFYVQTSDENFQTTSFGADGVMGGEGFDEDISIKWNALNWRRNSVAGNL